MIFDEMKKDVCGNYCKFTERSVSLKLGKEWLEKKCDECPLNKSICSMKTDKTAEKICSNYCKHSDLCGSLVLGVDWLEEKCKECPLNECLTNRST